MATVAPATSIVNKVNSKVLWSGVSTGDTITTLAVDYMAGLAGSVQFAGTFGGATLTLTGSNDGTNYVTLKDVNGNSISTTTAGVFEFSTTCLYIKPASSGGAADDVEVTVVLRGPASYV